MFETALRADAKRRIRQIGQADIVIGIPSYRNARTIGPVIQTVGQGLAQYFPQYRCLVVNADGSSSDETAAVAREAPLPPSIRRITTGYQGMSGKGSAIRAIFQIAQAVEARACAILDADLRNVTPEWVRVLVDPILAGEYEFVAAYYTRPRADAGVIDLLAYPVTRMLYGRDLRQPTGGEIALSGELAARLADRDVWETDVARGGIGVWLATMAIHEDRRLCQVALGTKVHDPREITSATDQSFSQTIGTLFRMAYIFRKRWRAFPEIAPVPLVGDTPLADPIPGELTAEQLYEEFRGANKRRRRMWQHVLASSTLDAVQQLLASTGSALAFPDELWARIVSEFIVVYNKGESDPDRVVEALLPIYYARQAAFMVETQSMTCVEAEGVVQRQAQAFLDARPYLLDAWDGYVPWVSGAAEAVPQ